MARLSISKAWDESRAIMARDGKLVVAVALALLVLPEIVLALFVPPLERGGSSAQIGAFIAALIGIVGQLAIIRLALGPSISVGEAITHGARRLPATLGAILILVLLLVIVLIPVVMILGATGLVSMTSDMNPTNPEVAKVVLVLLLVSVLIAVRLMMVVPVAGAESAGPMAIIKRSWTLTRGHYGRLLGLELILLVLVLILMMVSQLIGGALGEAAGGVEPMSVGSLIVGAFVGIGQAVFTIIASLMLARVYAQLAAGTQTPVSVPISGT